MVSHCYQGAHKVELKPDCGHRGIQVPAGLFPTPPLGVSAKTPKPAKSL